MPDEETNEVAGGPSASPGGRNVLGTLKGLFGKSGGGGLGAVANLAGGGKAKVIIPIVIVLVILGGAIFFVITAIAVYASRLGSVPGYAGGITSGTCPATKGWLVQNDTFDETGDQIDVVSVPDISQATQTETVSAFLTSYCPARGSTDSDDGMEGGEMAGPMGIKLGIGAVAVPKDPDRFPIGRTVLDIPGVGLRVAADVGGWIKTGEAGPGVIDIDVFSGWSTNIGDSNCDKHNDKWGTGGNKVDGVKVYVFKDWSLDDARSHVKHYDNQPACAAANSPASLAGGGSGNALSFAQAELGNNDWTKYTGSKDFDHAWCAFFVTWVYKAAGFDVRRMGGPRDVTEHFRKNMIWIDNPSISQIQPGDVIFFDKVLANQRGSGTHIGIVESIDGEIINTIEGNVGKQKYSDGKSRVERRQHRLSDADPHIQGVGRAR